MTRATTHSSGPYDIPHARADCYAMYTNNPPAGTNTLKKFTPDMQPDLADDEMRITFLGTYGGPPVRRSQTQMSIFVEVGPWMVTPPVGFGKAADSFVFDLGGGSLNNYAAMGISYNRMDKVFIAHLHADHTADLPNLYCFGPVFDRKWPLYIWGQGPSTVESPAGSPPSRAPGPRCTAAICGRIPARSSTGSGDRPCGRRAGD